MLPFKSNIVYIYIPDGEFFGEIDFIVPAGEHGIKVEEMIDQMNKKNFNLVR